MFDRTAKSRVARLNPAQNVTGAYALVAPQEVRALEERPETTDEITRTVARSLGVNDQGSERQRVGFTSVEGEIEQLS